MSGVRAAVTGLPGCNASVCRVRGCVVVLLEDGGMDAPAVVVPYDPHWPVVFAALRARADQALAGIAHVTEHVGSTAVPGLAAKPIIDVSVVVPAAAVVPPAVEALARAGWRPEGQLGVAGREALAPPAGLAYHHMYVVVAGSAAHRDHVDLRDFLRSHSGEAARYAQLKYSLAALLLTDRTAYAEGKAEMIAQFLGQARAGGHRGLAGG
jgi:GrpB-like predicted nucleotidyltransferase (UPF0157 family)